MYIIAVLWFIISNSTYYCSLSFPIQEAHRIS